MFKSFDPALWAARNDGPGPAHARWASVIQDGSEATKGVSLLGFASDEGVRRNHGRVGAASGPDALRAALAPLAIHEPSQLFDAGTIITEGEDLEGAQQEVTQQVRRLADQSNLVIVLGGGHETSFASHRGILQSSQDRPTIVNLDAHFDLRRAERRSSGTPFNDIADLAPGEFSYTVWGISRANNTSALFSRAQELGVTYVLDDELEQMTPAHAAERAVAMCDPHQPIHLSIDLDVLPASVAPGVSAPAGLGVSLAHIRAISTALAATGRLALVDVVELNPRFDVDNRTAKTAARLIHDIVESHLGADEKVNG